MTTELRLIQIGDVHYDDLRTRTTNVDEQDPSPPTGVTRAYHRPLAPIIAEALVRRLKEPIPTAVAVCGDLTSRGDLDVYSDALTYIASVTQQIADVNHLHIVPGNHDVDYKRTMPYVDLGVERFVALSDRVLHSDVDGLLTVSHRATELLDGTARLKLLSVNSCRAAGAPRILPINDWSDKLIDLIGRIAGFDPATLGADIRQRASDEDAPHELLDIPLILPADIDALLTQVEGGGLKSLPVVIAHHGFLPQAIPRFNPYTEMINGGQIREVLLKMDRPVVYLHGHVHRDSVEVFRGGPPSTQWGGPVVVIAAPLLEEGFNEILVEFSAHGDPLGLTLRRHRVDRADGVVRMLKIQRIPLVARTLTDAKFKPLIAYLQKHTSATGQTLLDRCNRARGTRLTPEEIGDFMSRAVWQGLIEMTPETLGHPFAQREFIFR